MAVGFETLGMGAGAAKSLEDLLAQRRADELMQERGMETLANMQNTRAWREEQIAQRAEAAQERAAELQHNSDEANKTRQLAINLRRAEQIQPGTELGEASFNQLTDPNTGGMLPEQFTTIPGSPAVSASLPSSQSSGLLPLGGGAGVSQDSEAPSQPLGAVPNRYRFGGTQGQLQKINNEGDAMQRASDLADLRREIADNANATRLEIAGMHQGQQRKPSFQEVDAASNMNSAEVQAVKVLKHLHDSGLDQSNDPTDPRWNTFVAQDLKMRPVDEGKADAVQRTQYVKAVLARAIMGGRPSQYVMQMIEQHLPDSKMTGKQLSGVINDVLDEVRTKRLNMQNFYGPDEAKQMEPVGGETYSQFLNDLANEAQRQGATGGVVPKGVTIRRGSQQ